MYFTKYKQKGFKQNYTTYSFKWWIDQIKTHIWNSSSFDNKYKFKWKSCQNWRTQIVTTANISKWKFYSPTNVSFVNFDFIAFIKEKENVDNTDMALFSFPRRWRGKIMHSSSCSFSDWLWIDIGYWLHFVKNAPKCEKAKELEKVIFDVVKW